MDSNPKREALKPGTKVLNLSRVDSDRNSFEVGQTGTVLDLFYYNEFAVVVSDADARFYFTDIKKIIPLLGKPNK